MKFEKIEKKINGYDEIVLPKMVKIRQKFNDSKVDDVEKEIKDQLNSNLDEDTILNLKGKRIAITAGSRGIPQYKEMLKTIIDQLKEWGAEPFVFPSMGSHAGGTAESQKQYLIDFGITEEYLGVPIHSSMDVVKVSELDSGMPIYCDKYAAEADGILLFHKIKPHTHFKGKHESGLVKMISIGIGKHLGAYEFHKYGFDNMEATCLEATEKFLEKMNVVFAVGVVQNAYDSIAKVEVIKTEDIIEKDAELQVISKENMPKLKMDDIGVLIIDEIGKDISGAGFDPNISGRVEGEAQEKKFKALAPEIDKIILLDISENSHGNALGCGEADLVSLRFVNKIDFSSTYTNMITTNYLRGVRIPLYTNSDLEAIKIGVMASTAHTEVKNPRVVRIKNTLCLEEIEVSEAYLEEIKDREDIEIISDLYEWEFNDEDNLW